MEETALELALIDVKAIRLSFEVTEQYQGGDPEGDKLREAVSQARASLLKNLNESVALLPQEMDAVFKHSAMLLLTPGVRRGFIDSMMKVDVLCDLARSEGVEHPGRDLYRYEFTREIDYFTISQMCGEQIYTLFLADIIENAKNDNSYKTKLDFDRFVAGKFIALFYAVTVAWRVFRTGEWPDSGEDKPHPSGGPDGGGAKPDVGGSGVPRVPLTPWLIGAAENEIPREVEDLELAALTLRR